MIESLWPTGVRCAAVFTFDNDDESGLIDAFGPERMFYVSQGYYDTNAGTWRVLRILERQNVKATFCMVGRTAEKRPDEEKQDIKKTVEIISKIGGKRPVGHRTPDWNPSPNTLRILHELGGFIWRGDSLDNDLPYIHRFDSSQIVELPSAVTLDDYDNYAERGYSPQE